MVYSLRVVFAERALRASGRPDRAASRRGGIGELMRAILPGAGGAA